MTSSAAFLAGTAVTIRGLKAKPELNGANAVIKSFNKEKQRFNVQIKAGETIALKPDNLEQEASARLPPQAAIENGDDYPISEVIRVFDVVEADTEYNADIAVACLTRCVEALMDDETPLTADEMPPERVMLAAVNALRTNARNEGAAPQLYGVAILGMPFLLGDREKAALVEAAEKELSAEEDQCSMLELLAKGLAWYKERHELCSSTMIALRQYLCCYMDGDDTIHFTGVDEVLLPQMQSSGLLAALGAMLEHHPPSIHDEGSLELHEHVIAVYSSVVGLQPTGARAALLVEAGAAKHTLGAIRAGIEDVEGPKGEEAAEAALEMIRSACALLQALGRTEVGRTFHGHPRPSIGFGPSIDLPRPSTDHTWPSMAFHAATQVGRTAMAAAGGVAVLGQLAKLMPKGPAKEVSDHSIPSNSF